MDFNFVTPGITIFIYFIAEFLKKMVLRTDKQKRWLPFICAVIGIVLAIVIYFVYPKGSVATNVIEAFATGALSGFAATGFNQLFKQFSRYSGSMGYTMVYPGTTEPDIYSMNEETNFNGNYSHSNTEQSATTINNNTTINNTINYGNEDSEDQSKDD